MGKMRLSAQHFLKFLTLIFSGRSQEVGASIQESRSKVTNKIKFGQTTKQQAERLNNPHDEGRSVLQNTHNTNCY